MSKWVGIRVCAHCLSEFVACAPAAIHCGSCIVAFYRCQVCGSQKPYNSQRPLRFELVSTWFCSNRCAGVWKFQRNECIRRALAVGRIRGTQHPAWQARPQPNIKGQSRPEMMAERNPNWRGGTSKPRKLEMGRCRYRTWRSAILHLDHMRCVLCGGSDQLEANHIDLWSEAPEKRYDESNGVALCSPCHRSIKGHEREFMDMFKQHVKFRQERPEMAVMW